MALVLDPKNAVHVRSGRYAQRERPAATIPTRLRALRARQPTSPAHPSPIDALSLAALLLLWRALRRPE
jgi:hypothetical protein